jgi:hypothetical protein
MCLIYVIGRSESLLLLADRLLSTSSIVLRFEGLQYTTRLAAGSAHAGNPVKHEPFAALGGRAPSG